MPIRKLMEQVIIERLLRARIYRTGVKITTNQADGRDLLVRDVRYDGSNSVVVVAAVDMPLHRFTIPLRDISSIELPPKPGSSKKAKPTLDDAAA